MLVIEKFVCLNCVLLLAVQLCWASTDEASPEHDKQKSDIIGFDAIRQIHSQIDNDHSGIIDLKESSDFLAKELNVKSTETSEKQGKFHNEDAEITVDDLWEKWSNSEESRWTLEQVCQWLNEAVKLSQYEANFRRNNVNGQVLPKLANSGAYLSAVLGIQTPFHRQKIQVKAMDVVLFGYKLQVSPLVAEQLIDVDGYEAIKQLHRHMDDDKSGVVDIAESTDFLEGELEVQGKDRKNKQDAFHHNDWEITVDDLWSKWVNSSERSWTVDATVQWLTEVVELPKYADNFRKHQVTGKNLPRIAMQNDFLHSVGIHSAVSRRKLQLKAMETILFGSKPTKAGYLKDIIMMGMLVLAVISYWFTASKNKHAQKELKALSAQMEYLKKVEEEFSGLKSRNAGSEEHSLSDPEEVENLKTQLYEAERMLEQKNYESGCAPLALQGLLRKTFELEMVHLTQQKLESLKEMREARDMIEKIKKKQSSFITQFRVAQLGIDDIDKRIMAIRARVEMSAQAIQESQSRWAQIESLCGFNIVTVTPTTTVGSSMSNVLLGAHIYSTNMPMNAIKSTGNMGSLLHGHLDSSSNSGRHVTKKDSVQEGGMIRNSNSFTSIPHSVVGKQYSEPVLDEQALIAARKLTLLSSKNPRAVADLSRSKNLLRDRPPSASFDDTFSSQIVDSGHSSENVANNRSNGHCQRSSIINNNTVDANFVTLKPSLPALVSQQVPRTDSVSSSESKDPNNGNKKRNLFSRLTKKH